VFGAAAAVAVLALVALVLLVVFWSGATLATDPSALARIEVQPLGGTLELARAYGPDGNAIPVEVRDGRVLPQEQLAPGEQVTVAVTIRRPDWLGSILGDERHERLTLTTPVAHVVRPWLTVAPGHEPVVRFDRRVETVKIGTHEEPASGTSASLGKRPPAGSVAVAVAARSWERVGAPVLVSWFPRSTEPVALVKPAQGELNPARPIRLIFSRPVDEVLGSKRPTFSPAVPGRWKQVDSHTLVFHPSGIGAAFAGDVRLKLGTPVSVDGGTTATTLRWTVPTLRELRLEQLLAMAGYLPVDWEPVGDPVPRTPQAQVAAAFTPPLGHFHWRFPDTPQELVSQWAPGEYTEIVRGAVMMFQHDHDLTVDAFAGPQVWKALIADTVAGKRRTAGYSYVYVHRDVPQKLTLWHNGKVVLTSPGNTGVPQAPTALGTFPVFEHIPVGTMSGTNPDGTHYNDPGIKWISYFHNGEALHAFPRASFGTPQSLGCVELPLDVAKKVWPYTPIGTLVTIEH
jgi:hypothetical protein